MDVEIKGPSDLENEVLKENLCTLCGACVGMCPYLVAYKGRVVMQDSCTLSQGRCYAFCPRTSVDLDKVSEAVFGFPYKLDGVGTMKEVIMARSSDPNIRSGAQYGGVVTALLSFALKEGFIDSAVLTRTQKDLMPGGLLAQDSEEIIRCSGSNYVTSPTLEAFNREAKTHVEKVGVVGIPCQVLALGKMRVSPLEERNNIEKLALVIGLFCTWGLSYGEFLKFLQKEISIADVVKFDIPPPPADIFEVYTSSDRISFPLDRIRSFIRPTCSYCIDMTAEFSDISVGSAEGIEGWNTVIIRSRKGADLIKEARETGVLEIDRLPKEKFNHLEEASLMKKKRALQAIVENTKDKNNLLYLKMEKEKVEDLLSQ